MKRVKDAAKESPGPGAVFFLGGDAPLRDPRQNRPQGTPAVLKRRRAAPGPGEAHKRPVRALLALTGHFRALRTPVMRASRVLAPLGPRALRRLDPACGRWPPLWTTTGKVSCAHLVYEPGTTITLLALRKVVHFQLSSQTESLHRVWRPLIPVQSKTSWRYSTYPQPLSIISLYI